MLKAANAYMQTQVTTTNQAEVLIMLYDGAIKFLNRAKDCIEAKDVAGKGRLISKALDIINELDCSLAVETGGELADNLHNLYFYCSSRLLMASLKMNSTIVDEVLVCLSGLRNAYHEIMTQPEAQAAAAQAAANLGKRTAAQTRPQPGLSSSGTESAAPSRGARGLSLYAQKTGQPQAAPPDAAQSGQPQDPAPSKQTATDSVNQATPEKATIPPPEDKGQSAVEQPALQEQPSSVPPDMAAKKFAASSMYRKFSAGQG